MNNKGHAIAILLLLTPVALGQAQETKAKVDPSGTWRWEYDMQGETVKDSLKINQAQDGKLTATYYGTTNEIEIKDAKIDGNHLTFSFALDFQGSAIELEFGGGIEGDAIDGAVLVKMDQGEQEFPWNPERSVKPDDVLGTWKFRVNAPERVYEPTLVIVKKDNDYKYEFLTDEGETMDVENFRIEKNHVLFTVIFERDGSEVSVDFRARPYGDKLNGNAEIDFEGQRMEAKFDAKRGS